MKRLIVGCLSMVLASSLAPQAFGWGAVHGAYGGAAYRGPMGGTAVRGPGGSAAYRGPAGGVRPAGSLRVPSLSRRPGQPSPARLWPSNAH